jgi:hypothetical protein
VVRNWFRWLPVLLVPFSVLFVETWLHTRILRDDYESYTLQIELRRLQESLKELRGQEASLNRLDRLDEQAPDLGLVEPEPDQIVILSPSAVEGIAAQQPTATLPEAVVK